MPTHRYTVIYLQYEADEHTAEIFPLDTELKLSECLDEWHAFNVTNSSTKLQCSITHRRAITNSITETSSPLTHNRFLIIIAKNPVSSSTSTHEQDEVIVMFCIFGTAVI